MTESIAIIGGGIVGATAAYYLTCGGHAVTVFDEGTGQATSAAAGIICPWLSKRRNKAWYRLAAGGAAFYQQLIEDLAADGASTSFYRKSGAILLKKKAASTEEQYQLGLKRREQAPEIGDLTILDQESLREWLPTLQTQEHALHVSGGARVDGSELVRSLLTYVTKNGGTVRQEAVTLTEQSTIQTSIEELHFDTIILAVGAWLPQLLKPLGWEVDIRGQKGQLVVLQTDDYENGSLPVVMPEGEVDVLPLGEGKVIVGASHENDKGYDLILDQTVTDSLIKQGQQLFKRLENAILLEEKVGTRAYTSDFSPFFGELPNHPQLLVASGLGSSGLTTGPFIGYQLARLVMKQPPTIAVNDYTPSPYLKWKGSTSND
ncbi:NAD(P)/FAD-dependent oxidoreductase [Jeotgalibaca caeni]|uniref:NAD(P)/FAD-dependent oxidoreductase n=1 Tax=Jeotgalibaca caeni TaxID=3028623 RepID=UPI00237E43FE|nr:FAD-dependent oxidoreductase [Jeotgalibaca caeni]MDE1549450.1 FAD-dependent oxidoreductase [Jeotgalibaca caeni]